MTPEALYRLLAELPEPEAPHPIDAGVLGEYAFQERAHGPDVAAEAYPRVAAHLRTECPRCQHDLTELRTIVRRGGPSPGVSPPAQVAAAAPGDAPTERGTPTEAGATSTSEPPEPIEIAEAVALARALEAERDALRAPLRPDRAGQVDSRRESSRRRHLLLVEAALIRQRLVARRLFLDRARLLAAASGSRLPNPKARLLLDDFAGDVDTLARLVGRVGRLTADLRRLGDDPRGPSRSQSEALAERGLALTRDALSVDRRLARLQGSLAGMVG